jgi:hypothetical protein
VAGTVLASVASETRTCAASPVVPLTDFGGINMNRKDKTPTRRGFLQFLFTVPLLGIIFRKVKPAGHGDLVEVDGWILRKEDVA